MVGAVPTSARRSGPAGSPPAVAWGSCCALPRWFLRPPSVEDRFAEFTAQLGGEHVSGVLHEQRHLVAHDLHVAVAGGQDGQARTVSDRGEEEVALLHADDGLLDLALAEHA